jgi:hypothetical protein
MSEVDPDPYEPAEGQGDSQLGGRDVPADGDPTVGGKRGEVGDAPSISADEPDGTPGGYPVGGGSVDPGSDA